MTTPTRTPEDLIRAKLDVMKQAARDNKVDVFNPAHHASWDDMETLLDALAQLREERDALQVKLDGWHYTDAKALRQRAEAAESALAQAQQARETLTKALRRYCQHEDDCESWPSFPSHFTCASKVGPCTCGLTEVLAALTPADGADAAARQT